MTWARLDDDYYDAPKVRKAWQADPATVGLHVMAIAYCARYETDGVLDGAWLEERLVWLPPKRRAVVLDALLTAGLFDRRDDGTYVVHDYLDYNPSRAELEDRRAKDAARKASGRGSQTTPGHDAESERSPDGHDAESERSPRARASRDRASRPDPTRSSLCSEGVQGENDDQEGGKMSRSRRPEPPPPDEVPPDLPPPLADVAVQVARILERVAVAKGAKPVTVAATGRAVGAFPDRDYLTVAGEFEHWWVHGGGAAKSLRDVVAAYRNRLSTVPPTPGGTVHVLPGGRAVSELDRVASAYNREPA